MSETNTRRMGIRDILEIINDNIYKNFKCVSDKFDTTNKLFKIENKRLTRIRKAYGNIPDQLKISLIDVVYSLSDIRDTIEDMSSSHKTMMKEICDIQIDLAKIGGSLPCYTEEANIGFDPIDKGIGDALFAKKLRHIYSPHYTDIQRLNSCLKIFEILMKEKIRLCDKIKALTDRIRNQSSGEEFLIAKEKKSVLQDASKVIDNRIGIVLGILFKIRNECIRKISDVTKTISDLIGNGNVIARKALLDNSTSALEDLNTFNEKISFGVKKDGISKVKI